MTLGIRSLDPSESAELGNFRPLAKLRDAVGDAFLAGIVLYLGERAYTYEDRLHVMPVDRLWRD